MTGYSFVLFCHSLLRWAVVLAGLLAFGSALHGLMMRRTMGPGDERVRRAFVGLFDLQFLLGLALYFFFSPIVDAFWDAPRVAMKEHTVRFFGIEHVTTMLIASVVLVWVAARSLIKPRRRLPPRTPADLGLAYEDIDLAGADDLRLAAWWIPADRPRATLVPLTMTQELCRRRSG